ncbi:MAG: RNA methyltransferase [Bacteroidetes bacterium]|nr:RNA methyltransferase [Bacteroidota bacterium]
MGAIKEYKEGLDFTAKTLAGLEEPLANELKELGADEVKIIKRGATFRGNEELLYKVNYMSRLAIRILKPIGVFNVKDDKQLYDKVRKINWMNVFNLNQTFSVDANLFYSELDHSHYAALKTKDAIVDQFRESTGKRPWVSTENPDIYIDVHISHDVCTISLDSSGESLHKREYRIGADKAPINEVLAAGMINLAGWKGDCDFYDPMCGSGTIPMEAAMLAMKIPAGYYRKMFAFMNWEGYNEDLWLKVKNEADKAIVEVDCNIYASDRSEKAIVLAKRNLKHAGLHKDIDIRVSYFDSVVPEKGGMLIMNPPYGIRMEERGELRDLYKGIGNVLKQNFTGFEAWVISPNIDTAKFIGLRPSKKIALYNGPIETRFLRFDVYEGTKRYGDKPQERSNYAKNKDTYKKDDTRTSKDTRSEDRQRSSDLRKSSYQKSRDEGTENHNRDFERKNENYRRSNYPSSEKRKRDYGSETDESSSEERRKINQERSKNFDRHMESLRRFTNFDNKKSESKKKGRKRISPKKPPEDDE